jgi:hypothetical protein
MRKSFDGLQGLVVNELEMDSLSGDIFIFINKRRDRVKILVWDRNGFWLFYKRLEQGCNPNIIENYFPYDRFLQYFGVFVCLMAIHYLLFYDGA